MLDNYDQVVVVGLFTGRWTWPDWYDRGKCLDMEWSTFFGTENETDTQLIGPATLRDAREICAVCPVSHKCLAFALAEHMQHGIWAGTSGRTRARIWAMERRGEVTREQVLSDYASGDTEHYEKLPVRRQMSVSISR
jgi:WhiB family redox-sensing transcriptional regulator